MANPTSRWITLASICRFWAGYSIGFFMPGYFEKNWPDKQTLYGSLNTIVVSICGFSSAIIGGKLTDKLEKSGNLLAKSQVCIIGTALGIPTIAMYCLSN